MVVPTIFLKSRFFLKSGFLKSRFDCTKYSTLVDLIDLMILSFTQPFDHKRASKVWPLSYFEVFSFTIRLSLKKNKLTLYAMVFYNQEAKSAKNKQRVKILKIHIHCSITRLDTSYVKKRIINIPHIILYTASMYNVHIKV